MQRKVVDVSLFVLVCVTLTACSPSEADRSAQVTAIAASVYATETAVAPPPLSIPSTATPTSAPPTTIPAGATPTSAPLTAMPAGVLVKPDNPIGIGGFWKSTEGSPFSVSLSDTEGRQAILEVQGELRWDKEGKLTKGEESTFRIQTKASPERWYKIVGAEVLDGLLVLTAEDGIYTYFTEGYSATPVKRTTSKVTVTGDGNWRGQASFVISGFDPMNFTASIHQDTRDYQIQ